jgi:hypothetical protein
MHDCEKWVTFRETKTNIAAIDKLAEALGVDRSGYIRLTMRAKLRAEADSK